MFFVKICNHIQQDHVVSGTIVEFIPTKVQYKYEFIFNDEIHYYYHDAMYFIPRHGSKGTIYLKVKDNKIEAASLLTIKDWEIAILLFSILFIAAALDDEAYRYPKPNDRYWNQSSPRYVLSFLLFVLCTHEALRIVEKYYLFRDAQFVEGVVTKKGTSSCTPEVQFAYNGVVHTVPSMKIPYKGNLRAMAMQEMILFVHSALCDQLGQRKTVVFFKVTNPALYDYFWIYDFVYGFFISLFAYFYWVGHKKNWRWRRERRR